MTTRRKFIGALAVSGATLAASRAPPSRAELDQLVCTFLLATTLKDVSVMATLQRDDDAASSPDSLSARSSAVAGGATAVRSALTTRVHYSVRLIDLDRKSAQKLPEYFATDRDIVQHFLAWQKEQRLE